MLLAQEEGAKNQSRPARQEGDGAASHTKTDQDPAGAPPARARAQHDHRQKIGRRPSPVQAVDRPWAGQRGIMPEAEGLTFVRRLSAWG